MVRNHKGKLKNICILFDINHMKVCKLKVTNLKFTLHCSYATLPCFTLYDIKTKATAKYSYTSKNQII